MQHAAERVAALQQAHLGLVRKKKKTNVSRLVVKARCELQARTSQCQVPAPPRGCESGLSKTSGGFFSYALQQAVVYCTHRLASPPRQQTLWPSNIHYRDWHEATLRAQMPLASCAKKGRESTTGPLQVSATTRSSYVPAPSEHLQCQRGHPQQWFRNNAGTGPDNCFLFWSRALNKPPEERQAKKR